MVVVVISLLLLAKTGRRRILLLGLALIYAGGSLVPAFSIGNKPVVVSAQTVPKSIVRDQRGADHCAALLTATRFSGNRLRNRSQAIQLCQL